MADTRGVGFDRSIWEAEVRSAAVDRNEAELSRLFVVGRSELGSEVGRAWARILSALDADAVTG